jgi:hypothetical protein
MNQNVEKYEERRGIGGDTIVKKKYYYRKKPHSNKKIKCKMP